MLLLLDNYDSFTYNLYHYLGELGAEVVVRRNDALSVDRGAGAAAGRHRDLARPLRSRPGGHLARSGRAAAADVCPLLGVCLGHQAIAQAFGGAHRARRRG